jgi:NADPH:quinone reductase-like Zn-dependent oxidoreductase
MTGTAMTSTTMKAVTQEQYGGPEVLELRDIPRPQISDDQVLIRVLAAGVNPADWAVMSGLPYIARPVYGLTTPKNPVRGTDVAGVVEAVGTAVTQFQAGDEVFGSADGSYAQFAAADPEKLTRKPANLTFEQAAAVPMAGLVALQAVRDHGGVRPGQRVLINGASGGIGTFAVQIAKALGAQVTGVCSTRNVELVRSLGADHIVDYTRQDFTRAGEEYDYVLDNVANHSLRSLRRTVTPSGALVPNGGGFDNRWFAGAGRVIAAHAVNMVSKQTVRPFLVSYSNDDLVTLRDLVEAGKVSPVLDRTFPLNGVADAIAYVGEGHARGKVVISL